MTDDLQSLWQSEAPTIDSAQIISGIERNFALQKRFNQINYAIMATSLLVVGAVDLQGAFAGPRGLLTGIVLIAALVKIWDAERKKRRCPAAAEMDPASLLKHAIRHVKAARNQARALYALYPISLASGFLVGRIVPDKPDVELQGTDLIVWGIGPLLLGSVVLAVVFGTRVARQKVSELRELKARAAELEEQL